MAFGIHSRHLQPFFSVYIYATALNVVTDSLEKVVITQINRALIYLIAFLFFFNGFGPNSSLLSWALICGGVGSSS